MKTRSNLRLGVITALLVTGFCSFVFSGTFERVTAPKGTEAEAVFKTTSRLAKGMPVRIGGVVAGRVSEVRLNPGMRSSTAVMTLFDEALPLFRNARADLRWRTALGGNYAIELNRGSPAAGRLEGLRIPESRTTTQVEVDEILAVIRSRERRGLKALLAELPRALSDERQPARAIAALAQTSPSLTRGLSAVRGHRPGDLSRLVANTARAVTSMSARPDGMQALVEGGAATATVTARRSVEIRQSIASSAHVLPRVTATLGAIGRTLDLADPVVARLRSAAPPLAATVSELRPTVVEADALLNDADPVVRRLRPAARSLAAAANAARPLVDDLLPILARIDERILADLARPDKVSGRPTYQMIGPTVAALDAAASGFDSTGHVVALTPGSDERAIDPLPCKTYFGQPNSPEFITCQNLDETLHGLPSLSAQPNGGRRP